MATYRVAGPMKITYDSQDLGVAREGCRIRTRTAFQPVIDDLHGEEPSSYIYTGKSCIIDAIGLMDDGGSKFGVNVTLFGGTETPGQLASAVEKTLTLTERDDAAWTCKAVLIDPSEILLSATQELRYALSFIVVPESKQLFSAVPGYISVDA